MNLTINSTLDNVTQDNVNLFATMHHYVIGWVTLSVGLPIILLAIYLLYFLIQADHITPIFVINLLIADLLQICMRLFMLLGHNHLVVLYIDFYGLTASVGFMVCIALERYLVIAFPLWYRFRRNINFSLVVASIVWMFPFIQVVLFSLMSSEKTAMVLLAILLLIPFPMLVFFLGGTIKALSLSISVPVLEKKRIIGTLVVVLGNYSLLFLPFIVQALLGLEEAEVGKILLLFSPLVDSLLYVFMRRGAKDTLLSCPCLDRWLPMEQDQSQVTSTVSNTTSGTV